jgi:hypothetical protein
MPVHVEKRGDKYRIVDPDGKIVKRNGSAVDGGGKKSKEEVKKQAAAINISLHKRGKI